MSSTQTTLSEVPKGLTRFIKVDSASYDDNENTRLFPFSYRNGILDITFEGNTFKEVMIDVNDTEPLNEASASIQIMSGPKLATQIGENFKAYIRSWLASSIDNGSPIEVYIPAQVIKVQEADLNNLNASGTIYTITEKPPSGDMYTAGLIENKYNTTYIFKTPLTITIFESSIKKYLTFRSVLDQE